VKYQELLFKFFEIESSYNDRLLIIKNHDQQIQRIWSQMEDVLREKLNADAIVEQQKHRD
jgi:L-rhamnose mutarotase